MLAMLVFTFTFAIFAVCHYESEENESFRWEKMCADHCDPMPHYWTVLNYVKTCWCGKEKS